MRSFPVVFLILVLSAGISQGQEADTSDVVVEAQPVQETAPVATATPEKAPLPRWALGFTASNLELKSWPGTVSLQRRLGPSNYLSLGISGSNQQWGPNEDTNPWPSGTATDTTYTKQSSRNWRVQISPEFSRLVRQQRGWMLWLGLEGSYAFDKYSSSSEIRHTGSYYAYSSQGSKSENHTLSLNIPASLEKRVTVWGHDFSLGFKSRLLWANTHRGINEYWSVYESQSSGYYTDHDRTVTTMPWNIEYRNPFQGGMQVQIKYWF